MAAIASERPPKRLGQPSDACLLEEANLSQDLGGQTVSAGTKGHAEADLFSAGEGFAVEV